jgi:hypothetical protein
MVARLSAKLVFLATAIALVFFGIGLIGLSIATALTPYAGAALSYAIAGVILLLPPLLWAMSASAAPPAKPAQEGGGRELMNSLFTALARETPWAAVVGAGLVGVANLFLNRNKNKK